MWCRQQEESQQNEKQQARRGRSVVSEHEGKNICNNARGHTKRRKNQECLIINSALGSLVVHVVHVVLRHFHV